MLRSKLHYPRPETAKMYLASCVLSFQHPTIKACVIYIFIASLPLP